MVFFHFASAGFLLDNNGDNRFFEIKGGAVLKKVDSITIREQIVSFYLYSISFLGIIAVIFSIFKSEMPSEPIILLLLAVFMGVIEYFPIRIGRGGITLSLTLIYPMNWEFGIHITVVACVCAMVLTHTLRRLPMQRTLFNCTQFALSVILAEWVPDKCISFFIVEMNLPVLYEELISFLLFTIFFCLINTLLYDFLMVLLPQPYPLEQWYKKNILVFLSASFCLCYASLVYILEHRYRGELDGINVLFFFFPLVAICIISSFLRQIRIEKERLYNLFSVTTELSQGLSAGNLHQMKQSLKGFLGIQAYALWTKDEGNWMLLLKDGKVHSNRSSSSDLHPNFEEISETFVVTDWKTGMAQGDEVFKDVIRSLVYLPLKVNHEMVGCLLLVKAGVRVLFPKIYSL